MTRKLSFSFISLAAVIGLLAGCAPAAAPPASPKQPAQAPAGAPTAPAAGAPQATPKPAAEQSRYGGTLTTTSRLAVPHFDMHQDTTIAMQLPLTSAYSMLVQNDPKDEDKVIGDLANKWDVSPDSLTYTFRLHEGVKFHDGASLTSADVKFNLDRIIFPPTGMLSARKELYRAVDKIEAPDPLTVKITLKSPQASFLQLMALPFNYVFAPEVIKRKGDMKRDVMGSGPFKFQSYTEGVSFKVVKNPSYFMKGRPYLDGITFYIVLDEMSRISALRTKQVLLLPLAAELTAIQAKALKEAEPKLIVQDRTQTSMTSFIPNTQVAPWSDVRVRKAVSTLLDREAGGKVVRAGSHFPGYGYVLPGSPWALPEKELMSMPGFRKPKDQDVAEAKKLLADAGFAQGFKTAIMTSSSIHAKEAAEFSKDQLTKLGVTAEVQVLELTVSKERLFKGAFEAAVFADASGHDDPDVILGEYYLTGTAKNYGKWSSPRFDQLYQLQSAMLDAAKRKESLWEMQRIIHSEAPRSVITWGGRRAVWWPGFRDWSPGKSVYTNHKFEDVWIAR
ncbi:MAG: hypothetical protein HYX92_21030 [Chloroflexi bacterium]|nr:hypothetical protein [Chloroflexota bacterium]